MAARGVVKLWVGGKQYGFVKPDDDTKDVFFHESVVQGGAVKEGDRVEYELAVGTKIPQATKVARVAA